MGLVAAGLALGAALVYPWPEPIETSAQVNQKLFGELDVKQVKTIAVVRSIKRIAASRAFNSKVRDSWFIPSSSDFPAGNVSRIAAVFTALGGSDHFGSQIVRREYTPTQEDRIPIRFAMRLVRPASEPKSDWPILTADRWLS
jgi:hypothetical protein